MKTVYLTGISGTGKTTITQALEKKGHACISIDEVPGLCFWKNKSTKERVTEEVELNLDFVTSHDWVCDTEKLSRLLKEKSPSVVAGIVANQKEFLFFFDTILLLQCSPEVLSKRLNQRINNDFGKDKEVQQWILSHSQDFEQEMLALGAHLIDAEKPLEEVVDSVLECLD